MTHPGHQPACSHEGSGTEQPTGGLQSSLQQVAALETVARQRVPSEVARLDPGRRSNGKSSGCDYRTRITQGDRRS